MFLNWGIFQYLIKIIKGDKVALIELTCKQCGGDIVLDDSQEFGYCEYCHSKIMIQEEKIINNITQNITKHVYGIESKDVDELFNEANQYLNANTAYKKIINIDPNLWSAWLGYASTGGDFRDGYLSCVPAYRKAYNLAYTPEQKKKTFNSLVNVFLPGDSHLQKALLEGYEQTPTFQKDQVFDTVLKVVGCDETDIAHLAIDLMPNYWASLFYLAKVRKVRARWTQLEGLFKKRLNPSAEEVKQLFLKAYNLGTTSDKNEMINYFNKMAKDDSYKVLFTEILKDVK